jgi:hypothetical protein
MNDLNDRISRTEDKLKQLKLRKQQAEARLRAIETKRRRSQDTRRKILIGAAVLDAQARGEVTGLQDVLDKYLLREDDRALFGLPPKPAAPRP